MKTIAFVLTLVLLLPATGYGADSYDLLIRGGRIVDGSGNPWFNGDIGIRNGKIVAIGRIGSANARRTIDAKGKIVAPGFIDVHGHIEGGIEKFPKAENLLQMGVTSVITGNCGFSETDLEGWFKKLEKNRISINIGGLIGHNAVRRRGMGGDFDRVPTESELARMRYIVSDAMRSGAVGFSTGLEYVPGVYASTDEIVALARESGAFGGIYTTHMRDEGIAVEAAINESIGIGKLADCPVQISHFKISAKKRWGFSVSTLEMVEAARRSGQQVTIDQYVYTAGATFIDIIFPSWVFDGGEEKVKERFRNPDTRAQIKKDMIEKATKQGFEDISFVQITSFSKNPAYVGKRLDEIAFETKGSRSADAQAELAIEIRENGGAGVIVHKMSDEDVDRILSRPFTMIASDAGIVDMGSVSSAHPRAFGNNARVIARYVREKKLITIEDAVRKMTSLPAQTFGLQDRGMLREGNNADIVIFDENSVSDTATFQKPKQFPTGFSFVIVNGKVTIEEGVHLGTFAGQIVRKNGGKVSINPILPGFYSQK